MNKTAKKNRNRWWRRTKLAAFSTRLCLDCYCESVQTLLMATNAIIQSNFLLSHNMALDVMGQTVVPSRKSISILINDKLRAFLVFKMEILCYGIRDLPFSLSLESNIKKNYIHREKKGWKSKHKIELIEIVRAHWNGLELFANRFFAQMASIKMNPFEWIRTETVELRCINCQIEWAVSESFLVGKSKQFVNSFRQRLSNP